MSGRRKKTVIQVSVGRGLAGGFKRENQNVDRIECPNETSLEDESERPPDWRLVGVRGIAEVAIQVFSPSVQ